MIILEILGEIFIEIIFEGIILRLFKLFSKGYDRLVRFIFGTKKELTSFQKTEKKILYKKFILTETQNPLIEKGMKGVVLEVIDNENVYAEFLNENGKQIEYQNELAFKIPIKKLKLVQQ